MEVKQNVFHFSSVIGLIYVIASADVAILIFDMITFDKYRSYKKALWGYSVILKVERGPER